MEFMCYNIDANKIDGTEYISLFLVLVLDIKWF